MTNKTILIYHSPLAENAPADELDVLDEAAFFTRGLIELGYDVKTQPFPYNLALVEQQIAETEPLMVVNLVETLFADGRLVHVGPFLFEHLKIPYTGCSAHSIYLTSHKLLAKQVMVANGISTPRHLSYENLKNNSNLVTDHPFLVKSLWEHASFGLDENKKLLFETRDELLEKLEQHPQPEAFFCEEYIHGREFNLSVLDGKNGPEVLPVAEIRFYYPDGKARILGYKAKWEEESFEYRNTVRSFDFEPGDDELIDRLKTLALKCWHVFGLRGYARVDFRVDEKENIFVLEINANPCISADSGFVAAAHEGGLKDAELVKRIVDATISK